MLGMNFEWRNITVTEPETLTQEEKKKKLYLDQKKLLDTFLSHGAITIAQYNKSLGDLTEKMGMKNVLTDGKKS